MPGCFRLRREHTTAANYPTQHHQVRSLLIQSNLTNETVGSRISVMPVDREALLGYRTAIQQAVTAHEAGRERRFPTADWPPAGLYSSEQRNRFARANALITSTVASVMADLDITGFRLQREIALPGGHFARGDRSVNYTLSYQESPADYRDKGDRIVEFSYNPGGRFGHESIEARYVALAVPKGAETEREFDISEAATFIGDPEATELSVAVLIGVATAQDVESLLKLLIAQPAGVNPVLL